MVKPRFAILLGLMLMLAACAASRNAPLPYMLQSGYKTTYYDRNGDGIVDFEFHELPDSDHYDWALTDRDFDGRYDLRLRYGIVVGYDKSTFQYRAAFLSAAVGFQLSSSMSHQPSNQSLQPTAGRSLISRDSMNLPSLQSTLALASGG